MPVLSVASSILLPHQHAMAATCARLPLPPCLVPFDVPANCADSATLPSCASLRIDRSVVAVPPRRHRAYSRRDLYPTSTPSTRHILKRTRNTLSPPSRRSIPLDAVEGKAVGLSVLLVSTSVEVCVARERARGLETRRSRRLACRSLSHAARRCQRCAPRSLLLHFACHAFFATCSA